jgi:hypothetical protein
MNLASLAMMLAVLSRMLYLYFGDELLTLREYRGGGMENTTKYNCRITALFIN